MGGGLYDDMLLMRAWLQAGSLAASMEAEKVCKLAGQELGVRGAGSWLPG